MSRSADDSPARMAERRTAENRARSTSGTLRGHLGLLFNPYTRQICELTSDPSRGVPIPLVSKDGLRAELTHFFGRSSTSNVRAGLPSGP